MVFQDLWQKIPVEKIICPLQPAVNMEENTQDVPPHGGNTVTGFLLMEQEIEKAKKEITVSFEIAPCFMFRALYLFNFFVSVPDMKSWYSSGMHQ